MEAVESSSCKNKNEDNEEVEIDVEKNKLLDKLDVFYKEYFLSDFQKFAAGKFIKDNISNPSNKKCDRIRDWLIGKLNHKRAQGHLNQLGCPEIIPHLTAKPFWGKSDLSFIESIESHFKEIQEEV